MPGFAMLERFDPSFDQASIPDPSRYWVTGLDPAGRTTSLDLQGYRRWLEPYEYPDYPTPIVTHRQLLVAGTMDRTWYGTTGQTSPPGGVNLGYFIVQKWTNRIVRQKEGGT